MTDILVYEEVICTNDAVSVECWRAPLLSLPQGRYSSMYPPLYCTRRALTGAVFFEPGPHSVKAGRLSSQKGKVTELRYEFMLPAGTAILNSDCTDMKIIDLLLNDFSVFGLRIQYWIPAVIGVFSAYGLFDWLDRKRHQKGNAGRAQCDAASNLSKGRNTLAT